MYQLAILKFAHAYHKPCDQKKFTKFYMSEGYWQLGLTEAVHDN